MEKNKDKQTHENRIDYEPKSVNRFRVEFSLPEIPNWSVKSITKPVLSLYSEKEEWMPMTIEFCDFIAPSISQIWFIHIKDGVKNGTENYSVKFYIYMLDPVGIEVEKWEIDAKLLEIDFGRANYYASDENNKVILRVVVKPIDCILRY